MTSSQYSRPCPRCGGDDRFYFLAHPRNGNPRWQCRQCNHVEGMDAPDADTVVPIRQLTSDEISQVQTGYAAVAHKCAELLWTNEGNAAQEWLRQRGFTENALQEVGIGFHPDTWHDSVATAINSENPEAYEGARLGGVIGRQGRPTQFLHGVIILPYRVNHTYTLLRSRKLEPGEGPKYRSPGGLPLFAGATPSLYLQDVLKDAESVILTEGEFKAIAVHQAWRSGAFPMPAVAQPGIGYLPDAYMDALRNKTVYLCYDREQRSDPFRLSPGEDCTIRNGETLTGLGLRNRLQHLQKQTKGRTTSRSNQDNESLTTDIQRLEESITSAEARNIKVKVLRLPSIHGKNKVDLDDYLLSQGTSTLAELVRTAPSFSDWHRSHGPCGYHYEHGGIYHE